MRILVIGGQQFMGRETVRRLVARSHDVTVLHRHDHHDLGSSVRNLQADRSCANGLHRYVFMSSIAAYGSGTNLREEDPLAPDDHPNPYVQHKASTERVLLAMHKDEGFPVTTFRPPFVHGPRQPFYREQFFWDRLLDGRPIILPDGGDSPMQWVFVSDVAEACVRALEVSDAVGEATLVPVPRSEIHAAGGDLFGGNLYHGEVLDLPPLTSAVEKASRVLDFTPTDLDSALRAGFEWYKTEPRRAVDYSFEDGLLARACGPCGRFPSSDRASSAISEMTHSDPSAPSYRGLDVETGGTGITRPLSQDVNLLGALLGAAIRREAGEEVFQHVEELRLLCKRAPELQDPSLRDDAAARIAGLDEGDLGWLLRSYSAFFHLVNQAEKREILRINRERSREAAAGGPPRPESMADAVGRLKEAGCSLGGSWSCWRSSVALTRRPTRQRAPGAPWTIRSRSCWSRRSSGPSGRRSGTRSSRGSVFWSRRSGRRRHGSAVTWGVRCGSTTARRAAVALHRRELVRLREDLSISEQLAPVPRALRDRLSEEDAAPDEARFTDEPYRRLLSRMIAALDALSDPPGGSTGTEAASGLREAYGTSRLVADLELIRASLEESGFAEVARHGHLSRALVTARTFGFTWPPWTCGSTVRCTRRPWRHSWPQPA